MLQLIGVVAIVWFMFWSGIAQAALLLTAAVGTMLFY